MSLIPVEPVRSRIGGRFANASHGPRPRSARSHVRPPSTPGPCWRSEPARWRVPVQPPPTSLVLDVVTFSLANEDFAIELGYVHKIVPLIELTPVPGTPDFIVGVINLRGEILPIVDLHRLYGMARTGWTDQSWVIVLGGERNEFALLADKVHEVITLRTDQVLDWQGSATGVGRQFVRGVTEGALIVLDGAALLQDDRLFIDQGGDGAAPEPGEIPMAKSSKSKKPVVSATSPNKKPSPKGRKGGDKVFMQNEELYRLFVDSIKDYAILMLDPTGHVLSWNPGAELLKGYHADEIIGKHFSIFYPREDVEHGKPEMELRVATNENRFEDEGWRVRKDGSRFWASVIFTALRDETQRLVGFGKITRDLTGRWQAEETLRSQVQLLDLASDSVMIRDLDDRIVYWNKGSERLYGWKKEHVLGQVVYTFLQTEFPGPKAEILETFLREGRWEGELDPYLCGWPARHGVQPLDVGAGCVGCGEVVSRNQYRHHPAQAVGG